MSEESSKTTPCRVVFDANVFIQAVLSGRGPAFECVELVEQGQVVLCVTESILAEVDEVLRRLGQNRKYRSHLNNEAVSTFMAFLRLAAQVESEPPHVFDLPRDKDDEVYIDLAITTGAVYLASRDMDLLDLMDLLTDAGSDFRKRFPTLTVLNPVDFLERMRTEI